MERKGSTFAWPGVAEDATAPPSLGFAEFGDLLAHACEPLETEWIRAFMFQQGDAESDLSILTAPGLFANACRFTASIQAFGGLSLNDMRSMGYLLIPYATIGPDTVGLMVQRGSKRVKSSPDGDWTGVVDISRQQQGVEHVIGRFHLSNATGSLLLLAKPMVSREDELEAMYEKLAQCVHTDENKPGFSGELEKIYANFAPSFGVNNSVKDTRFGKKADKSRVFWWDSIRMSLV